MFNFNYDEIVNEYYDNHGGYSSYFSKKDNREIHTCNVCRKEYKNLKSLQKHLEQKDCYRVDIVFKDTAIYKRAKVYFKTIHTMVPPSGNSSGTFHSLNNKRQKELLCAVPMFERNIANFNHYVFWTNHKEKNYFRSPEHAIMVLTTESNVRKYQQYLISHQNAISLNENLYVKALNNLLNDNYDTPIKYLERALISINSFESIITRWAEGNDYDLEAKDALDYFIDCLSPVQKHRLTTIVNTICYTNEF